MKSPGIASKVALTAILSLASPTLSELEQFIGIATVEAPIAQEDSFFSEAYEEILQLKSGKRSNLGKKFELAEKLAKWYGFEFRKEDFYTILQRRQMGKL